MWGKSGRRSSASSDSGPLAFLAQVPNIRVFLRFLFAFVIGFMAATHNDKTIQKSYVRHKVEHEIIERLGDAMVDSMDEVLELINDELAHKDYAEIDIDYLKDLLVDLTQHYTSTM